MLKNIGKFKQKLTKYEFKKGLILKGCSKGIQRLNGHRRGNFKDYLLNSTTNSRNKKVRRIGVKMTNKWLKLRVF